MKRFLLLFILLLTHLGCDDNLDLQPTDSLSPDTLLEDEQNLGRLLLGAYAAGNIQGGVQSISELYANEGQLVYLGFDQNFAEFNRKQLTLNNFWASSIWSRQYEGINLANIVLDNLDLLQDLELRNSLEGEARFLRGLYYFELVRLFALPYEPNMPNAQLGLPIVTTGVLDLNDITYPSRNSVDEVYELILSDLEEATELLPEDNGYRADRYAALALLARVYLQQGNFAGARDAAHEVLSESNHSLASDYSAAFNNDSDGPEDLFMYQITSQDGFSTYNARWASQAFGGFNSTGDISIDFSFLNLFTLPDDRANFFYEGNETILTRKWQSQFANVPFLRVAEMHLIRAECNFREGTSLGLSPEQDVNALRARANATPIIGLTLQDILEERERELAFEGHVFHDLKRLQSDIAGFPYNADNLVMPIPRSEVDTNPNIVQNPGYNN